VGGRKGGKASTRRGGALFMARDLMDVKGEEGREGGREGGEGGIV